MKSKIKAGLFILAISIYMVGIKAQSFADLYKRKEVVLEEVADYAAKNNWEQLFQDYNKVEYGSKTGQSKGIAVAPDSSVFMCHKTLYEIWKFDKNGNFIKKFGSKGNGKGQFPNHFGINCTYDGKYIFTSDNQGNVFFFDLEGNYVKSLKIDFMPLDIISLRDSKLAIMGFVAGKINKTIIQLHDYETGKIKTIWTHSDEEFQKSTIRIKLPTGGGISMSLPNCHEYYTWPRLATLKNGNLLIGLPEDGKMLEYSINGEVLNSFQLNIKPIEITDKDIDGYYQTFLKEAEEVIKDINASKRMNEKQKQETIQTFKSQFSKAKDKNLYPSHLPYFSTLILDSDGNLLVFEFTKEQDTNKFKAFTYDASGKEIGSSSFVSENYKLSFASSSFKYRNGYIYALAFKNGNEKVPLRLVKFKCKN